MNKKKRLALKQTNEKILVKMFAIRFTDRMPCCCSFSMDFGFQIDKTNDMDMDTVYDFKTKTKKMKKRTTGFCTVFFRMCSINFTL